MFGMESTVRWLDRLIGKSSPLPTDQYPYLGYTKGETYLVMA